MKSASAATLAILNNADKVQVLRSDLWTITLKSGTVIRWTSADHLQSVGGIDFATGPIIQRSQTKQTVGVTVDSLQVTLTDGGGTLINGKPVIHQFRNGLFDGATVKLQKLFLTDWADTSPGAVDWFEGRISDVSCDHMNVNFAVKDMLELLNQQQPTDVHQASCNNTLFDDTCGAVRASFTFNCTSTSVVDRKRFTLTGTSQATGYFALGKVKFTSGQNAGLSRTVKSYIGGVIEVFNPFPYDIGNGDTLQAESGCDKTYAGGCAKHARQATGFKAYEFIPVPETAIEGGGISGSAPSTGGSGTAIVGSGSTAGRARNTYVQ